MNGENLRNVLRSTGLSMADIAAKLEMSPQALNQALNAADIKSGLIERVCDVLNISMDKLYGRKEKTEIRTERSAHGVPYYKDLPVSAGQLDIVIQAAQPAGYVDLPGVTANALFPVVGCSMKPEINPGDVIGISPIDAWEIVDPDKVYLIVTADDRMIKHLSVDENDDSILWCMSPNYPKFKVNKSDIKYIYRVTFCGKLI